MFYPSKREYPETPLSLQRLYLAGGETTIRTGGTVNVIAGIKTKPNIDADHVLRSNMDVTGSYFSRG